MVSRMDQDDLEQAAPRARRDDAPARRTQEERSAGTIARLSDATIDLMAEGGLVNLTTTRIARRAGVSRGAMLHHFPSKRALVMHATGQMWGRVVAASERLRAACDPDRPDPPAFVEALWTEAMTPTHVSVTADVMVAARGDPELQAHLDAGVARMFASYRATARHAFGKAGLAPAECDALTDSVAATLRGLRLAQMLSPDPARAEAVRAMLVELLTARLAQGAG